MTAVSETSETPASETPADETPRIGYAPEEIVTSEPTRSARYKWAVVVDTGIPAGRMVNAVACVAASTGSVVEGLIAPGGCDHRLSVRKPHSQPGRAGLASE